MPRRSYSPETKAQAIARVLAGESISQVARDMGIERTALQHEIERKRAVVTDVVTSPSLKERMTILLEEQMTTLTVHARHYRSDEWLHGDKDKLLESTRTIGSRFTAIMDRIAGAGQRDDSDPS